MEKVIIKNIVTVNNGSRNSIVEGAPTASIEQAIKDMSRNCGMMFTGRMNGDVFVLECMDSMTPDCNTRFETVEWDDVNILWEEAGCPECIELDYDALI